MTAFSLAFLLIGCAALPVPVIRGPQTDFDTALISHYAYTPQTMTPTPIEVDQRDGYSIQRLTLQGTGKTDSEPLRIDWYKPDSPGPHPVILISPILAGDDLYINSFAKHFAAKKLHGVIVYRPEIAFKPDKPLTEVERHFQESILLLRKTIDLAEHEPSMDADRMGAFGISLGSNLITILSAVEPRVKAQVLALPSGRIAEIIMQTKDKSILKKRDAYLREQGWTKAEGLSQLREAVISDPIEFGAGVPQENTMVIAAVFDRVVGFHRSMALWRTLGRPQLMLLPTGHYTAALMTPLMKVAATSFLKRRLDNPLD